MTDYTLTLAKQIEQQTLISTDLDKIAGGLLSISGTMQPQNQADHKLRHRLRLMHMRASSTATEARRVLARLEQQAAEETAYAAEVAGAEVRVDATPFVQMLVDAAAPTPKTKWTDAQRKAMARD